MPSILILMPLAGLIILNLPFRETMKRLAFWFAAVLFFLQILLAIFHHPVFWYNTLEPFDTFFNVKFSMDNLSFIALLSIGIVSLASLLVARALIRDLEERFNFINLLIIASIGMAGIVMVKDIFSLYVFIEITAVSSFILIACRRDIHALEGAFKYILLSAISTVLILSSIALFLCLSGDVAYSAIRVALSKAQTNPMTILAIGLFSCGLFIKGGIVPFHGWLPDAYSASPSAASVLLAGIVTKIAGIYTLIRLMIALTGYNLHAGQVIMFLGAVSMLMGAFAAVGQSDFKRMLAYSSISQAGYILLGFGTGSALGIFGAMFHFFNHAIFKSLLFVNAAAVEKAAGTDNMDKLSGLSSKMPVTGATSVIGLLSAGGIPPLAGFWSKLIIIMALWLSGYHAYAVLAVLTGVLTLAYLLSMQRRVFFGKLKEGLENIEEAHAAVIVASLILAVITVGIGIFFPVIFTTYLLPVKGILVR